MVKFFIIILLGCSSVFYSFSNPLVPPPMITEIHFGAGGWSIELLIQEYYNDNYLDNLRIRGLYDTAQFVPGIEFVAGEVFFVTPDDFITPFNINQAGDYLYLEELLYDDEWIPIDYYGFPFGDLTPPYYSELSAPVGEESVAWQLFTYPENDNFFWTVKELPNTIGYSPFQVSKRAAFSGYVRDRNDDPLGNVQLYYCYPVFHYATTPTVPEIYTDENGYFYANNMFCKKYFITFFYDGENIGNTWVFVEPDSANYYEIQLDTLLTGLKENKPSGAGFSIHNLPNPSSNQTTFLVESYNPKPYQEGVIKIYSEAGYIVDIIPIEISGENQEVIYNFNDKSLASGLYFYNLEIGHQKKAGGKMVISR